MVAKSIWSGESHKLDVLRVNPESCLLDSVGGPVYTLDVS